MDSPKYERTFHLPWSPGGTSDDKRMLDISGLLNTPVVITEKMDGSNVCMERQSCFARTHSGPPDHPSFDAFKQLHGMCKVKIPINLQIFGEWCYALHSIAYDRLPSFFLMFGVRDLNTNMWLSWEEVELWSQELEVPTVPVLASLEFKNEKSLKETTDHLCSQDSFCGSLREGIVVRVSREFSNEDFSSLVGKIVRANHVTTDQHWKSKQIVRNKIFA